MTRINSMTHKPSSANTTGSSLKLQQIVGQAAFKAGTDNDGLRMEATDDPALKLAQKAMREGKAGLITDGKGNFAIVER
jgi:hypothetical protein